MGFRSEESFNLNECGSLLVHCNWMKVDKVGIPFTNQFSASASRRNVSHGEGPALGCGVWGRTGTVFARRAPRGRHLSRRGWCAAPPGAQKLYDHSFVYCSQETRHSSLRSRNVNVHCMCTRFWTRWKSCVVGRSTAPAGARRGDFVCKILSWGRGQFRE